MKILSKEITENEGGRVSMVIQESEDLWHAYNLIHPGDHVNTKTTRKVSKETASGSNESEKISIRLSIKVHKIDFDPMDNLLRLSGKVTNENKWVKLGSHHTVELGIFREFTLWKHEWDEVSLMRLEDASTEQQRAAVAAIVMQEGIANICLMTETMTLTKAHITQSIPRKRKASANAHDKSVDKFYQVVYESMMRIVDFKSVQAVIIASPGFIKDQFYAYITAAALKADERTIIEHKAKFMLVHSNSGHRHALTEVLRDPAVAASLSDVKAANEIAVLTKFNLMLAKDDTQAVYSKKHVQIAAENGAVEDLLLSDNLFRARGVALRREYVELVESVKAKGGKVHIFSSLHVSGEQLAQYSGVAAILRFPLPEILEDEDDDNDAPMDEDNAAELDEDDPSLHNQEENPFGGTSIQVEYEEDDE